VFNKLEAIQKARRQQAIEQAYLESLAENTARPSRPDGFVLKSAEIPAPAPTPEPVRAAAAGQMLSDLV
jgi:hypothetical protein